jgi:hypothetical protein
MKPMVLLSDVEGSNARSESVCRSQDKRKVDVLRLSGAKVVSDSEYFAVADHVVHSSETQLGHDGSEFIGDVVKEVDDMLGCTNKLLTEFRILSSDTDGASVQLKGSQQSDQCMTIRSV